MARRKIPGLSGLSLLLVFHLSTGFWTCPVFASASSASSWISAGNNLLATNDLQGAKKAFEQAVKAEPTNADAWLLFGSACLKLKAYSKAKNALEKSASLSPRAEVYLQLSSCYEEQRQLKKAQSYCEQASRIAPSSVDAWTKLVQIYLKSKQQEKAAKAIEKLTDLQPKNAYWWDLLGETHLQNHSYEKAEHAFCKSLDLKPNNFAACLGLARALADQKRFAEARAFAVKASSMPEASGLFAKKVKDTLCAIDSGVEPDGAAGALLAVAKKESNEKTKEKLDSLLEKQDRSSSDEKAKKGKTETKKKQRKQENAKQDDQSKLEIASRIPAPAPAIKKTKLTVEQLKVEIKAAVASNDFPKIVELANLGIEANEKDYYFWWERGYASARMRKFDDALRDLDKARSLKPGDFGLTQDMAAVLFNMGNFSAALPYYDQLLAKQPQQLSFLIDKGKCLQALSRYNEAAVVFDQILKLDPKRHDIAYEASFCLFKMGRYDNSINLLTKLIGNQAQNDRALELRCRSYLAVGQNVKAYDDIKAAQKIAPAVAGYYMLEAEICAKLAKPRGALQAMISAHDWFHGDKDFFEQRMRTYALVLLNSANARLAKNTSDINAYDDAALANICLKDYVRAIQLANKAISLGANNVILYRTLGKAYYESEKYEDAYNVFSKGLLIDQGDLDCLFQRGRCCYFLKGREASGVQDYLKYLDIGKQSDLHVAYSNLGGLQIILKQYDLARSNFEKCLSIAPRYSLAKYKLSVVAEREGKMDEAFEWLERYRQDAPDDVDTYLRKAYLYTKVHDWNQALAQYRYVAKTFPKDKDALKVVADYIGDLGAYGEAQSIAAELARMMPADSDIAWLYGVGLLRSHKYGAAMAEADRMQKLDPKRIDDAVNLKSTALFLEFRLAEAISLLRSCLAEKGLAKEQKPTLIFMLACMHAVQDKDEEALKECNESAMLATKDSAYYVDKAQIAPCWLHMKLKQNELALRSVEKNLESKKADEWPNVALEYLRGKISSAEFESSKSMSHIQRTDAYCLIGLVNLYKGNMDEVERCYKWVDTNGDNFCNWYLAFFGEYWKSKGRAFK